MDNSRMSTADMLQYCNEALAWEDFGAVDIFFFESVKKILLGQCSAMEEPEEVIDDLMGIERPVRDDELAPDYDKYADDYYYEEGETASENDDEIRTEENAFSAQIFNEGFFVSEDDVEKTSANEMAAADGNKTENGEQQNQIKESSGSFTVNV